MKYSPRVRSGRLIARVVDRWNRPYVVRRDANEPFARGNLERRRGSAQISQPDYGGQLRCFKRHSRGDTLHILSRRNCRRGLLIIATLYFSNSSIAINQGTENDYICARNWLEH